MFERLKFDGFAKTSEKKVSAGNTSWSGKNVYGLGNYLEFFRPGGMKGAKFGEFGMGFISDHLGTIDALQRIWSSPLDSVHVENKVITDNGVSTPWFKSVSIPNTDSSKVTAWAFENAREEMQFAGFTEKELSGVISYTNYYKHLRAKFRIVPIDSIKSDRLFDHVSALEINLDARELAYLRKFLPDIGFRERGHSFKKEGFTINYTLNAAPRFALQAIHFSLIKTVPRAVSRNKHLTLTLDGRQAVP